MIDPDTLDEAMETIFKLVMAPGSVPGAIIRQYSNADENDGEHDGH
jgi:hypothetical protein